MCGVMGSLWGALAGSDRVDRHLQAVQRWGPYRGRTQVPALPGVGREVVQDEVTQGPVEVLACGEVDSLRPWPQAARPLDPRLISHLLTSENSQQPRWGQEGTSRPDTGGEGGVTGTHVVPPASPLVLPQVQVTGASQETRLTEAWSQGLEGRGHKGRDRERERKKQTGSRERARARQMEQNGGER